MVSKNLKSNEIKVASLSDIAMLTKKLSKRYSAEIIQVYAPSSTCEDQVTGKFFEAVAEVLGKTKRHNPRIIMGDFKTRIGIKHSDEYVVGAFRNGTSDERGKTD